MTVTDLGHGTSVHDLLVARAAAAGAASLVRDVDLRRRADAPSDASFFFADGGWADTDAGRALLDALRGAPECAEVATSGKRLTVRFADDWLAALGGELESGVPVGLDGKDLLAGRAYVVDYVDPNATKALHVGHLRNIALGSGVAAMLEAAGADVVRQAHFCDIGRNVCEAMAGYTTFHDGEDPRYADVKPDEFVGRCYADFIRHSGEETAGGGAAADAPIARELEMRDDLAQRYMQAWMREDEPTRALWRRVCDWALDGQRQTLARLGVELDRSLYESDSFPAILAFVERGVAEGWLRREDSGAVVYDSGKEEFGSLPLLREDGFPTQHLRGWIGIFLVMREKAADLDGYVHVSGDEWQPAVAVYEDLFDRLGDARLAEVRRVLFHGMVRQRGAKLKSSSGDALLIDTFLDRLLAAPEVQAMVADGLEGERLAALVTLTFFQSRPAHKPIEFAWDTFFDESQNPGWLVARSLRRAAAAPAGSDPDPHDPAWRYAVLQTQTLRRMLSGAAPAYDVSLASRFVAQLARWHGETREAGARVDRVLGTLLRAALPMLAVPDPTRP